MGKTLYMLIGPKGSGKTYIGSLIGRETDITFLRVENIWLNLNPGEDGWQKVEEAIDREFMNCDNLMIENLGAGDAFLQFRKNLRAKYGVKMIRVMTDPGLCLERVKNRDSRDHISVSDDKVREYNAIAAKVSYDWSLEIDNNGPASDLEILDAFRSLKLEKTVEQ